MSVDFIGIGAQKAATSWIAECLRQHPEIHLSSEKELHVFSTDAQYARGIAAYEERVGGRDAHKKVGEFSTSYLCHPHAAERIYAWYPSVKLIVSLRDPVERALSHIEHLRSRDRLSRSLSDEEMIKRHPDIVTNGLYGEALARFFATFPRERVHVVWYDDIQQKPKEVMHNIYAFLGVAEDFVPTVVLDRFNTAEVRSSLVFKWVNKLFFFLKQSGLGEWVLALLRRFGFTSQRLVWILNRLYGKREYANSSSRAYLRSLFLEDSKRLEHVLHVSVPHWKDVV